MILHSLFSKSWIKESSSPLNVLQFLKQFFQIISLARNGQIKYIFPSLEYICVHFLHPSAILAWEFTNQNVPKQADVRTPDGAPLKWATGSDVEAMAWVPSEATQFLVSTEDGLVAMFDARSGAGSAPLWRLSAHDKPTCALSMCPAAPGLLATASTDKKVWGAGLEPARCARLYDLLHVPLGWNLHDVTWYVIYP